MLSTLRLRLLQEVLIWVGRCRLPWLGPSCQALELWVGTASRPLAWRFAVKTPPVELRMSHLVPCHLGAFLRVQGFVHPLAGTPA